MRVTLQAACQPQLSRGGGGGVQRERVSECLTELATQFGASSHTRFVVLLNLTLGLTAARKLTPLFLRLSYQVQAPQTASCLRNKLLVVSSHARTDKSLKRVL